MERNECFTPGLTMIVEQNMYIKSGWMPARALERDSIKSSLLFSYIVGSLFLNDPFFRIILRICENNKIDEA